MFTIKQNQLENIRTRRSRLEKASIRRKLTWGCFVKNSLFDSLFPVNLRFSLRIFCMFWKDTMYRFLYWENRGLERLPNDVGFVPNLSFNAENLPFIVFGTLACIHMPVYVYTCMKHVYIGLEHTYAYACMRTHALSFPSPIFFKNSFI